MRLVPGNLRVVVTTAGTRVPLSATNLFVTSIIIQAVAGNSGTVYVGMSTVASTLCISSLSAGVGVTFSGTSLGDDSGLLNLAEFYIDSSQNNDAVNVGYLTQSPGLA